MDLVEDELMDDPECLAGLQFDPANPPMLGGQRPTQLLRVTPRLVDVSGATLTLLDPKGRNRHANPRRHVLPILEDLMPVIRRRLEQTQVVESPLFSTNGRVPLRKEIVASLVEEIEKAMLAAGELERGPFSIPVGCVDLEGAKADVHIRCRQTRRDLAARLT